MYSYVSMYSPIFEYYIAYLRTFTGRYNSVYIFILMVPMFIIIKCYLCSQSTVWFSSFIYFLSVLFLKVLETVSLQNPYDDKLIIEIV